MGTKILGTTVVAYKTGDQSKTNDATLGDDLELKFYMQAGEIWCFEIVFFFSVPTTGPDIKFALNGPISPTNVRAHANAWTANAATLLNSAVLMKGYGSSHQYSINYTNAPDTVAVIRGTVENGANAGNFVLQWAQRVSNANATTVKKGSYIVAHRIQ